MRALHMLQGREQHMIFRGRYLLRKLLRCGGEQNRRLQVYRVRLRCVQIQRDDRALRNAFCLTFGDPRLIE